MGTDTGQKRPCPVALGWWERHCPEALPPLPSWHVPISPFPCRLLGLPLCRPMAPLLFLHSIPHSFNYFFLYLMFLFFETKLYGGRNGVCFVHLSFCSSWHSIWCIVGIQYIIYVKKRMCVWWVLQEPIFR